MSKKNVKYLYFNNIKPLIEDYCNTHKHPDYIRERIFIFITQLYYSQLSKKTFSTTDDKKYTYFNREELRVYLTRDLLEPILDELVSKNIIEISREEKTRYYSEAHGKYLFTYRFKIVDFNLFKGYTKKTSVNYTKNNSIFEKLYRIKVKGFHGEVLKIINMECKHIINITEEQYYNECVNYYPSYCDKTKAKNQNKSIKKQKVIKEFDSWYNDDMLCKLELIQSWNNMTLKDRKMQKYVKIDNYGNRKHTIFTNIPSFCRKYIDGFGKDIMEIDLHQSQPTIFNRVLLDRNVDSTFNGILTSSNNDIYDYYTPDNSIPRAVKKSLLFGGIFTAHGAPEFLKFENTFKEEGEMMRTLQKGLTLCYTGTSINIPRHKNISCLLQRKESEIFKQIWIKLINKRIKFISVHDAIYCSKEDYDLVKRTMTFTLNAEIGKGYWKFNK